MSEILIHENTRKDFYLSEFLERIISLQYVPTHELMSAL